MIFSLALLGHPISLFVNELSFCAGVGWFRLKRLD